MTKRAKALVFGMAGLLLAAVTGASVIASRMCPYLPKRLLREMLSRPYIPGREVEFRWKMSGSGTTADAGRFDDTQYVSSDCVKVEVTYYTFSSSARATEHFNNSVKNGRKIHTQEGHDEAESVTHQRAVFSTRGTYQILRQDGNRLLQIESSSLSHAIEYERRLSTPDGGQHISER